MHLVKLDEKCTYIAFANLFKNGRKFMRSGNILRPKQKFIAIYDVRRSAESGLAAIVRPSTIFSFFCVSIYPL